MRKSEGKRNSVVRWSTGCKAQQRTNEKRKKDNQLSRDWLTDRPMTVNMSSLFQVTYAEWQTMASVTKSIAFVEQLKWSHGTIKINRKVFVYFFFSIEKSKWRFSCGSQVQRRTVQNRKLAFLYPRSTDIDWVWAHYQSSSFHWKTQIDTQMLFGNWVWAPMA